MTWSLNELEAETRKAVRGAGLSWGLAEEGSKAVRWLAAHGVDALPALSDILDRHERRASISTAIAVTQAGHWQAAAPMCPIALGAILCDEADRLGAGAFIAGPVARPLLLVPFAAAAARILQRPLQLNANGKQVVLDRHGDPSCDVSSFDGPDARQLRCAVAAVSPFTPKVVPASTRGIATEPTSLQRIAAFVHRTYVPASERSRREGAGAGLIDND